MRVSSEPIMAITSSESVLASIDGEAAHDANARADIAQLKAFCDAADIEAFTPVTSEEITDQRIPAFLTQLGSIVQQVTQAGVNEQILSVRGLNPQANWDRIGRCMQIPLRKRCVVWLGINFRLWKTHGAYPLWMVFQLDEIGRIRSLGKAFSDWRNLDRTAAIADGDDYVVPIMIPPGEEQSEVVRSVVEQMRSISVSLEAFLPQPSLDLRRDWFVNADEDVRCIYDEALSLWAVGTWRITSARALAPVTSAATHGIPKTLRLTSVCSSFITAR